MTVRFKILALSLALLAILCAALLVALHLQREVHDEIATITEYHLPLGALLADTDAAVLDYQLNLARVTGKAATPGLDATVEKREREIVARLNRQLDDADSMVARAVDDPRNDLSDRITFARMQGSLKLLRREVAPLEAAGRRTLEAWRAGDREGAAAQLDAFTRFERLVGPDLAALRRDLERLSADSVAEVVEREDAAEKLSIALFLLAALVGLGLAGVMSTRLVSGLLRLVAGAKELERGEPGTALPVTSRDEIGQLTRAFNNMVVEIKSKDRIKDTFGKYVDPKIVAGLIDAAGGSVDHAERREATIFFSDIAGFSGLSEQLTAAAIANLLNRWFALSTDAIRAHQGVLDKYIGDAVMAFWAPPFVPGDGHAAQACLAALAQRDAVTTLRVELPDILGLRRQVPEFNVRMGLATGAVVLGTIGGPTAKSYTVIGDVVNLASRLEAINKIYGTTIIAAEETWRLAQGAVEARELDTIVVGGKTEPVRIFEILARAGALAPDGERLRRHWAEALDRYRARDWRGADSALDGCLEVAPQDGPARLFRERVARFAAAPPPADWDGITHLAKP